MPIFSAPLPLSLYIHIPWCVQKCPYCDFNSHTAKGSLPEELYVAALLDELASHRPLIQHRPLVSIFFGGGTPSLFSGHAINKILTGVSDLLPLSPATEITLEANPGTVDQVHFDDYRAAGINRLSLGVQSFQNDQLKKLGRIHDSENVFRAVQLAKGAGFENFNLDIMYGLPNQSVEDALYDIKTALELAPTHFSWYQLTIEPNTLFHTQTPTLPTEEIIWDIQLAGQAAIQNNNYQQYEVSAYAKSAAIPPNRACSGPPGQAEGRWAPLAGIAAKSDAICLHNQNYWEYGDYLGIGAGAHSKITDALTGTVTRFSQVKNPRDYLDKSQRQAIQTKPVTDKELIFEFMLNALRLTHGVPRTLFTERTGLPVTLIEPTISEARLRGLLTDDASRIRASKLGQTFLNDLVGLFL